jgi:zinc transport system substrate-binding protein
MPLARPVMAVLLLFAVGCGDEWDGRVDGKLAVAVTVAPQAWLIQRIGGEQLVVTTVVPVGQEPHSYQVTDARITEVARSAVYFRSGLSMESGRWFRGIRDSDRLQVVDLRTGLRLRNLEEHGHDDEGEHDEHGHHHDHGHGPSKDPHIWLSPRGLIVQAGTVLKTLQSLDAPNTALFQKNHDVLVAEIKSVDIEITKMLAPLKGKAFFIYHPSWGYFADDYGLEQVAIQAKGKEPSDAEVTALQVQARKLGITTIFVQPQLSGKGARAIAEAVGAVVVSLDPLAADVLDNMKRAATALVDSQPKKATP